MTWNQDSFLAEVKIEPLSTSHHHRQSMFDFLKQNLVLIHSYIMCKCDSDEAAIVMISFLVCLIHVIFISMAIIMNIIL